MTKATRNDDVHDKEQRLIKEFMDVLKSIRNELAIRNLMQCGSDNYLYYKKTIEE